MDNPDEDERGSFHYTAVLFFLCRFLAKTMMRAGGLFFFSFLVSVAMNLEPSLRSTVREETFLSSVQYKAFNI